ncbi:guanylate kinase [Candidatus Falkowbacteria bacterium]|nr:guanylate kinase [Candidatus Falkowbacteria bacterium]
MNKLILLTGPSGVGKTTVALALLAAMPNLQRLVTYTTRAPRPNEKNDVDYHFVSAEKYQAKLDAGDFFEHAEVYGHLYGNCRQKLKQIWDNEKIALMVLDIQGVRTIEKIIPEAISIFLFPDTLENLKKRIRARPMSDEDFEKRLQKVEQELAEAENCDFQVINEEGKMDETVIKVKTIISRG